MSPAQYLQVHQPQYEKRGRGVGEDPEQFKPLLRYLAVYHRISNRRLSW